MPRNSRRQNAQHDFGLTPYGFYLWKIQRELTDYECAGQEGFIEDYLMNEPLENSNGPCEVCGKRRNLIGPTIEASLFCLACTSGAPQEVRYKTTDKSPDEA